MIKFDISNLDKKYSEVMECVQERHVLPQEAVILSAKFLKALYEVNYNLREVKNMTISLETVLSITYKDAFDSCKSEKATDRKVFAEADSTYNNVRTELRELENAADYLKKLYELFNNAHIFYRGITKDNG